MRKSQATELLNEDGIDWTSPVIEIIDTLAYALSSLYSDLSWDDCIERAEEITFKWIE